ncbi:hypothetical protein V6N11_026625 [Hibiscus sabdariffa]|uniref:Uncharacterized protein n=1 Tax=Hibiscus sabdariffa TaxID=183260 RepID=A0ABR2SX30_9ROSI
MLYHLVKLLSLLSSENYLFALTSCLGIGINIEFEFLCCSCCNSRTLKRELKEEEEIVLRKGVEDNGGSNGSEVLVSSVLSSGYSGHGSRD